MDWQDIAIGYGLFMGGFLFVSCLMCGWRLVLYDLTEPHGLWATFCLGLAVFVWHVLPGLAGSEPAWRWTDWYFRERRMPLVISLVWVIAAIPELCRDLDRLLGWSRSRRLGIGLLLLLVLAGLADQQLLPGLGGWLP